MRAASRPRSARSRTDAIAVASADDQGEVQHALHHQPLPDRRLVLRRLLHGGGLGARRVARRADLLPYLISEHERTRGLRRRPLESIEFSDSSGWPTRMDEGPIDGGLTRPCN